mmetsp:Transcript_35351/g.45583  ORF Transcript_35351/g.45583 Transcript_35351/m.45583 type:complete len:441 (+) Transcript_35351:105-1427(+)
MNIGSIGSAMLMAKDKAEEMRIKARGSEVEKRLMEAMSNENWGASSSLMNNLAQDTYDFEKYPVIMKQIWSSLDNTATSWRKVFKALSLLEHLIKNGNERIVEETRDHMRKIRSLTDFNFYEGAIDRGSGIREKSKNIIELLQDNERIREERGKARALREKFSGSVHNPSGRSSSSGFDSGGGGSGGFGEMGSYSSGGIGSNSFDNQRGGGNRGGNEPPRRNYEGNGRTQGYSDSGTSSSGGNGRYSEEPSFSSSSQKSSSGGGHHSSKPKEPVSNRKFDIKIKSAGTASSSSSSAPAAAPRPPPVAPTPEPEPDLFGLDNGGFSSNAAPPAAPVADFDAFGSAPPMPPSNDGGFTDFNSAPPQAQPQTFTPNFDANFGAAPAFNQPMGQPMNQPMGQPMNQPMGYGQPMNQPMGQPMGQQQQQQQQQQGELLAQIMLEL